MNLPRPTNPDRPRSVRRLLAATLSLPLLGTAFAQTATTTPPSSAKDDDVINLSPFVVDSQKDVGYRATSTLAGTRINTDLKDVAAPIQVVTKQFMNDLNAVDINDVLAYTANTEGTRSFNSSTVALGRPSDDVAGNPQGATRVRGLAAPDITRDYFYTLGSWVGFDSYNLDEVTIDLGPNSVLAGLGSPAGIINYSPQLASLSHIKNQVSYRIGSWNDQRATLNMNYVVKKDVLAFRVAGEWAERGFKQKPAWDHDKRFYAAATYKPWAKTTIRANYEIVRQDQRHPNTITPEDDITPWLAAGKPIYDSTNPTAIPGNPGGILWTYQDGNEPSTFYNANGSVDKAINTNTGYIYSQAQPASVGIWVPQRMRNNQYIDLQNKNLNPSVYHPRLETYELSLDQQIIPHLDLNLSFLHEHFTSTYLSLFRAEYASYYVDINKYLPDGTANPHLGETFMAYRGLDNLNSDDNTNRIGRATLAYDLDLNKYNKWLGRYKATAFAESRRTETKHRQYNSKRSDQAFVTAGAGSGAFPETGNRYYLGGTAANGYVATAVPQTPVLVNNVPAIDMVNGKAVKDTMSSFWWLKSQQDGLTKLNSSAIALQGYLFGDRIVPMLGIRRDKQDQAYASVVDPGDVNSSTGLLNPIGAYPPFTSFALQTKTYGVVVHPYPIKWISFHYNHAENFNPTSVGKIDLLGNAQPSPHGTTKDYGFSIDLFDSKLNIKVNKFELKAENGDASSVTFPLSQWTIPFQELVVEPELAKLAGITYKPAMAPGITVGDSRLGGYTSNQISKGIEISATYNPNANWRFMGTLSKQEAKQTGIASGLTAFIEDRLKYWQSIPALWTGPTTQNNPWGLHVNGQQMWQQYSLPYYVAYKAIDGQPSQQLAKWHASFVGNYTFTDSVVKGLYVGTGLRYQDKQIIGNPAIYSNVGGTQTVTGLDLAHPYTVPAQISVDAWIGYTWKFQDGRYALNVQLNGQDLQESGGFRAILANSDGNHAAYKIVQPRAFYLRTTLEF